MDAAKVIICIMTNKNYPQSLTLLNFSTKRIILNETLVSNTQDRIENVTLHEDS